MARTANAVHERMAAQKHLSRIDALEKVLDACIDVHDWDATPELRISRVRLYKWAEVDAPLTGPDADLLNVANRYTSARWIVRLTEYDVCMYLPKQVVPEPPAPEKPAFGPRSYS